MFEKFFGNRAAQETLGQMIAGGRIPQTLLLSGPEGVGKATLARRFAARLMGEPEKIERDDLSLPANVAYITEREKWPSDKRNEDPLHFASHSDFVTFAPDGPLRQITIQQMRLLKERAPFKPNKGSRRVFLIDRLDRANEQAANSLLKTLEEPPDHLIIIATAANPYDLLPTIRSRSVSIHLGPLSVEEMREFVRAQGLDEPERRVALAQGSPGLAISIDLDLYDKRRTAMLGVLEAGAKIQPFAAWTKQAESAANRTEKLEPLLRTLYDLLEDVLVLQQRGTGIRNIDIEPQLRAIAEKVDFAWIRRAVTKVDELSELVRRNIQKNIALDAMVIALRAA